MKSITAMRRGRKANYNVTVRGDFDRREAWPQGRREYRHGGGAAVRPKEYCAKAVQLIRARTQRASDNQQVLSQESGSPAR